MGGPLSFERLDFEYDLVRPVKCQLNIKPKGCVLKTRDQTYPRCCVTLRCLLQGRVFDVVISNTLDMQVIQR